MLKRTINYEDLDGNPRSGTYTFHLSKAELVEMQASHRAGLQDQIRRVSETRNQAEIVAIFKDVICRSYGVREGDLFVKNEQVLNEFMQTPAYSALFMELATDEAAAAEFIAGILPKDMKAEVEKAQSELLAPPSPPVAPKTDAS